MKLICEVSPDTEHDEIIIRCRERNEKIRLLEGVIENVIRGDSELALTIRDREYYVPKNDILYFETDDGRVKAHTAERIFTTEYKLFELEKIMPPSFVRVSKSCVLNIMKVESIKRNPLGASEVQLRGCDKRVYVSRAYYKLLRDRLDELRLKR